MQDAIVDSLLKVIGYVVTLFLGGGLIGYVVYRYNINNTENNTTTTLKKSGDGATQEVRDMSGNAKVDTTTSSIRSRGLINVTITKNYFGSPPQKEEDTQ